VQLSDNRQIVDVPRGAVSWFLRTGGGRHGHTLQKNSGLKMKPGISGLEDSKTVIFRSLGSPDPRRGHRYAIDESVAWSAWNLVGSSLRLLFLLSEPWGSSS
jgi:hypothetical protein